MTDDTIPLSPRHERFVAEYLKDLDATQAYIRAGYAPRDAQVNASKLLRQPRIEAAIAAGRTCIARSLEVTVERITAEYAKIASASIDDFITADGEGRVRVDLAKAGRAKRDGLLELSVTDYGDGRPQRVKIKLAEPRALDALARQLDVLVTKSAPQVPKSAPVTPEDLAAAQARPGATVNLLPVASATRLTPCGCCG